MTLNQEQSAAIKEAVANKRHLWKIVQEMERVSCRIILVSAADTRCRKCLSKKISDLI